MPWAYQECTFYFEVTRGRKHCLQEEEEELQSIISPTALSDNFGVDIYIRVWDRVYDVIVNNNH